MASNSLEAGLVSGQDRGSDKAKPVRSPLTIGALLALLIGAAILPPLVFSVFLLDRNNRAQQEVVATLAEATAAAAIETVDRQLQGMVTTLKGLSTSTALSEGNYAEFYNGAKQALTGTNNYILVLDEHMNQLLNTRQPFGTALGPTSDQASALQALGSGQPVVSNAFLGRTSQKWVFNIVLPLNGMRNNARLLAMTQNAETLVDALSMEDLRGGWNAVIVDRRGTVLASTLMSADVGKPFFLDTGGADVVGGHRVMRLDGEDYEVIAKRSDFSGWRAVLWAESGVIERPMFRTMRLLVLGGIGMLAVGGVVAWLLGRQISKSVRRLAQEARQLGAGETFVASSYPIRELVTVSTAMADAAEARRKAENEVRFLMREVAHRSKNQLTVVSSIAKQSARNAESVAAFSESFQHRLMGLARSTDLLISGSVAGVELGELLRVQIEPFQPEEADRLLIQGPPFRLSLPAAQTLGLAIHEMATNAAKYGAFAAAAGRLSVTWKIDTSDLKMVWREYTPTAPEPSDKRGFGSQLIERMLVGGLGAKFERNFLADGMECRFEMPVANLKPGGGAKDDAM